MTSVPLDGEIHDGRHVLTIRVYYEDTDFTGIVYHANYLRYMERGRTNYLRLIGADHRALFEETEKEAPGFAFVVRSMNIEFFKPARMDDVLEIVTEPDVRSPADARGCLEELRLTLRYLEVSDCEMQEGSLRCDANVNLHIVRDGPTIATPIVEIKNLNSFRSVEKALHFEIERQYQKWRDDGLTIKDAPKTTRGWNDVEEITKPQREKESVADYRYFPEPEGWRRSRRRRPRRSRRGRKPSGSHPAR